MTTAAQAIPALEVSAPDDDMDVLSDDGFDFGDGDIDLDLDTALSVHDDDMSLHDAGTDGGLDLQELPADQDDFMADHGDLIEEDDVYGGDETTTAVSQDNAATFEADMLAPPDEDLIDYSDDEAQQPVKMLSPSVPDEEDVQVSDEVETASVPADDHHEDFQTREGVQPLVPTEVSHGEAQTYREDVLETLAQSVDNPEHHRSHSAVEPQLNNSDEEHAHADDDGGVMLPADENLPNDDDAAAEVRHEDVHQEAVDTDESEDDDDAQNIELRPVTVNYAGNELWLFKQHDLDESGDFLLEDPSAAKSSISGLFQACRQSLGDDVSGEHEIGFRFDNLHNLELYEDNTACVAVSLERLVDLYHTLQAQDGIEDPECFYITLQFRPRFATLLADIAQYAEQGSGYLALNAAVVAGETHFSNIFSNAPTEHENVDWDNEENDDQEASSPPSIRSIASQGARDDEPVEQQFEDAENQEEHSSQDHTEQYQGVAEEDLRQTLDAQNEEPHIAPEAANVDSSESVALHESTENTEVVPDPELEAISARPASEPRDDRTPDQIAHDKQEAEDFVDYSDDEDEQDVKSVAVQEPSPSSSTIQGDEQTETQGSGITLEDDREDNEDTAEADVVDGHDDDTTLLTQTQYGDDANHYAFQDYAETYDQNAYDQGDPFQDFQADGTVGDPFEADDAFNGETNQDFADYNFQTLEANFAEQPLDGVNGGDHPDETFAIDENATDADTFLDLDNAPEWAIDADPSPNLPGEDAVLVHDDDTNPADDEGGAVDQSVATTSVAANLASTSSNEHKPSSPQGQKRSIDEVGYGIEDAPNSTGTAQCSPRKRCLNSNVLVTDAKRPRV